MKVLIIGASFCGLACAKQLLDNKGKLAGGKDGSTGLEVVLVDPRDYFDANFMTPRLLQEPEQHTATVRTLASIPWLAGCTLIRASVAEMQAHEAFLSNGDSVKFDFCVICTGSTYSDPFGKSVGVTQYQERVKLIEQTAARVKAAASVLVIGGGITGVEMAGEAREAGAASVTLVHSGTHLGPSKKQGAAMLKRLQQQGVVVELNARAEACDDSGGKRFRVAGGAQEFSEVFWCVGNKPVSAFGRGLGDVLSPSGHFVVNSHFQVQGHTHIFAIGDCVSVDDTQLSYLGMQHAVVAAHNVIALARDPDAKLKAWKRNAGFKVNLVVMGKKQCLALLGETTVLPAPALVAWFKNTSTSKTLALSQA